MNVYDFDHTIYDGDSSLDFSFFFMRRHLCIFLWMPIQFFAVCGIKLKIFSTKRGKEIFFSFLKYHPATDIDVSLFWEKYKDKITTWYLQQQKDDDLIISASPYFLLVPMLTGVMKKQLLATQMDPYSGKITGGNCKGTEKISILQRHFPVFTIENFYSDSLSDAPLAKLAGKAFIVRHKCNHRTAVTPWQLQKAAKGQSQTL